MRVVALALIFIAACTAAPAGADPQTDPPPAPVVPSPAAAPTVTAPSATDPVSAGNSWAANARGQRGSNGQRFEYECPPGGIAHDVWGTDLYTDDSSVCSAAVHAGLISLEQGGSVSIEIRPGANSYTGSLRNGIEASSYGPWPGSFIFPDAAPAAFDDACQPEQPSAPPATWAVFESADFDFSFSHPADWQDRSARITFQPAMLLDPLTAAELPAGTPTDVNMAAMLVDPVTEASFAVMAVGGIGSPTDEVYPRMVDWISDTPLVSEVLATDIPACLDGQSALGVQLTGANAEIDQGTGEVVVTDEEVFVAGWFVVRDGVFYYIQWVGEDPAGSAAVADMLRSWRWSDGSAATPSPPPAVDPSGTIVIAGMALEPPPSGGDVDPSTFRTSFDHSAPKIYLVYKLAPGSATTVTFRWYQLGEFIFDDTYNWTATTTWGFSSMGPPPGGTFEAGPYAAELILESGESRRLEFVIEGP